MLVTAARPGPHPFRAGGVIDDPQSHSPADGTAADRSAPAWFRALDDTALALLAICRTDGTLLDANRQAFEACGLSAAEEIGRPFWATGWWAGSTAVAEQVRAWCAQVAAGGEPVRARTSYFTADGTERRLDLTLQLVHDQATGVSYLLPNGTDVTDQQVADRASAQATAARAEADALRRVDAARSVDLADLRAVQAQLSRALELSEKVLANTADGIYGLDTHGRVEFVNPAAERITGRSRAEQLGGEQHTLIHGRRLDGTPYPVEECPIWQALRTGDRVVADDEVFWRRDGTPVPVELVAVPTVEDGAVTGVVVSFRDLTDRRAAAEQAAELRRLELQAATERALSDRLQQALLTPPPEPDHLHVVVRYQPATHGAQVGGDWYDAFLQPDGATVLVIGDVVGHDSRAAAAMGQWRGLVRALAYDHAGSLPAVLQRAELTAEGLAVSTMATVLLARIEARPDLPGPASRLLRWVSAGHLPPLLLAPDGTSTLLETRPDLMLGVAPDVVRADHEAPLPDHTTLLLFTDGLVERSGSDLDAGLAALQSALADLGGTPLDELCDTLLARLVPENAADDVALVAVRMHPEDRPRPAEAGPRRLPPPQRPGDG
ncbi:SpoIIE family protein phosphatase [Modestobacter italicus]|uniref:SpoIIE family protein phosphatase n=1 Tax=Modestobacter italicus (strain DSM 44449 / CECT 9708 / BC 501) TaxID=2732864 RepID=UPI001C95B4FD|nr:SpoIIE family protein phosphatase [Modestobacter italicus]